jgi:hypothetical protein
MQLYGNGVTKNFLTILEDELPEVHWCAHRREYAAWIFKQARRLGHVRPDE